MINAIASKVLRTQSGMVLLLCLIFLTALTLLGLSATSDTILQNQLSANLQESERAKQSALATLAWAENWLLGLEGPVPEACTSPCEGLYLHPSGDLPPHPETEAVAWWMSHGHEAGINPLTGKRTEASKGGGYNPPLWVIETAHSIPPEESSTGQLITWYRILARGSGHNDAVISVVESVLVRSWHAPGVATIDETETCSDSGSSEKCGRVSWRELR